MKKQLIAVVTVCTLLLTACAKPSENAIKPLMGLDWFTGYDDVKSEMDSHTLIEERENEENNQKQKMQDYADVSLFDYNCDLTLCFTDSGLIGFNYHDVERNQGYKDWYSTLETNYGLPTEEGGGMASWYNNPLGKNTAVYLFNLEEGVQVSIYATADSPDKSYEKHGEVYIPTPEIRTPVVPVVGRSRTQNQSEAVQDDASVEMNAAGELITTVQPQGAAHRGEAMQNNVPVETNAADEPISIVQAGTTNAGENTMATTENSATASTTTIVHTVHPVETEPPVTKKPDQTNDFKLNGLQFYGGVDSECGKMSAYTQLYEYRTEEPGQPWELIMEYENASYLGKNCDAVLCFTSLGLVGINYFDSNTNDYSFWTSKLTEIYGTPDEVQYDYMAWSSSPIGSGTMIYVFALEDGVQISFFADDTGSELT